MRSTCWFTDSTFSADQQLAISLKFRARKYGAGRIQRETIPDSRELGGSATAHDSSRANAGTPGSRVPLARRRFGHHMSRRSRSAWIRLLGSRCACCGPHLRPRCCGTARRCDRILETARRNSNEHTVRSSPSPRSKPQGTTPRSNAKPPVYVLQKATLRLRCRSDCRPDSQINNSDY